MSRGHSRRALLGSSAVALLLAAPAAGDAKAAELDGELIRLCGEYVAADLEWHRLIKISADWPPTHPDYDEQARQEQAVADRCNDLFDRLADPRPRTPEGLRAMALAALHSMAENMSQAAPSPKEGEMGLAWAVCGVLAGRADA